MKFIKDINGNFIHVYKITAFTVEKDQYGKWVVCEYSDSYHSKLKEFSNEAEARSWLKELVIQIDDELSGRNLTSDLWKQFTQLIKDKRNVGN